MSLDVIKYAIRRVTATDPKLGYPKSEAELDELAGETITPKGIGGENAFKIFRDVLLESSVSIDHPRHLAFVPASPTRAGIMFAWPGLGMYITDSLFASDVPAVLTATMLVGVIFMVVNIASEVIQAALDPRSRLA